MDITEEIETQNELEKQRQQDRVKQHLKKAESSGQKGAGASSGGKMGGVGGLKNSLKKIKFWFALIRLIFSEGLDPTAWYRLFKERPVLTILLVAFIILLLIALVVLVVVVIIYGTCQMFPHWVINLFSYFNDQAALCKLVS